MTDILKGVTVLDLTQNVAGPFCTQLLGDFGAEVFKVERPDGGDDARKWVPPATHGIGTIFLSMNRNKRSVGVDIACLPWDGFLRARAARGARCGPPSGR